jgi:integrase/recombinase XerD
MPANPISQKESFLQDSSENLIEQTSSQNWEKTLPGFVLRFLNSLKKHGKSINTVNAYKNDLCFFTEFIVELKADFENFSFPIQEHWLQYLKDHGRHSHASQRRAQMSVRSFLHFLIQEKVIESSPLLETKSPRQPAHSLLIIPNTDYEKVLDVLKKRVLLKEAKSIRDLCLLLILGELGLKASEAASMTFGHVLKLADVKSKRQTSGHVKVPGQNERILPISKEFSSSLKLLKKVREDLGLPTDENAKLFFGFVNISRKVRAESLHRHGIKFVIYEICEELLGTPYNAESLRNRAIKSWLEQGFEQNKVADLAGYSSLNSLERFYVKDSALRSPRRQAKKESKK